MFHYFSLVLAFAIPALAQDASIYIPNTFLMQGSPTVSLQAIQAAETTIAVGYPDDPNLNPFSAVVDATQWVGTEVLTTAGALATLIVSCALDGVNAVCVEQNNALTEAGPVGPGAPPQAGVSTVTEPISYYTVLALPVTLTTTSSTTAAPLPTSTTEAPSTSSSQIPSEGASATASGPTSSTKATFFPTQSTSQNVFGGTASSSASTLSAGILLSLLVVLGSLLYVR